MHKKRCGKIAFTILLITMISIMSGCGFLPKTEENRIAPISKELGENQFSYIDVFISDIEEVKKFTLSYHSCDAMQLSFGRDVMVDNVYVSKGDIVKAGDLLLEADSTELKEDIAELEETVKNLENNINYYSELIEIEKSRKTAYASYAIDYDDSMLSEYETLLDNDTKSLNVAKLQLSEASEQLEDCRIYAPFDGIIGYIASVSHRDKLLAAEYAVSVYRDEIYFSCTTSDYAYFEIGENYTCSYVYNVESENTQDSDISSTGNKFGNHKDEVSYEQKTGEIQVTCVSMECKNENTDVYEIKFSPVSDASEITGIVTSNITFVLSSKPDALCIPKSSLITTNEGYAVYMLAEDGSRIIQNVDVGIMSNDLVEIINGLKIGDRVISDRVKSEESTEK